jgi:hypothetical protein
MVLTAIPPKVVASTGWRVDANIAGGLPANSVAEVGDIVFFSPHSKLTPAGIAAILSQMSTYLGGLGPVLLEHTTAECGLSLGKYSVQNIDLAAQQTIIFNLLATAANVTGPAT